MKKFYSLLLMLLMAVLSVGTANARIVIASGDGWSLVKIQSTDPGAGDWAGKSILYISSDKASKDYVSASACPWNLYRGQVNGVSITADYEGTKRIGAYMFTLMVNLEKVSFNWRIATDVTYPIGAHAFESCVKLKEVPSVGAISIGDYAFKGCTKLETVYIHPKLTSIGAHAFEECSSFNYLTNFFSGNFSYSVGDYAFCKCSSLKYLMDDGKYITSVGEYGFANCALVSMDLENCKTVGARAFNMNKLSYLHFGSAITSIGEKAFYAGMVENGNVSVNRSAPPTTASDAFLSCPVSTIILDHPSNSSWNVAPWNKFKERDFDPELYVVVSGTTLTMYYDGQCYSRGGGINYQNMWNVNVNDLKQVTKVVIDQSVASARPTSTVNWFYYWFENLTTIEGIEYLNTSEVEDMSNMFNGCKKLKAIDVSHFNTSKCTDMGSMFCGCAALTELNVNSFDVSKVTDAWTMFAGCTNLKRIYCEKDWTSLGNSVMYWAFNNCTSLTGGWGTPYDQSYRDAQYARPDGGSDAPGYFWRGGDTGQEPEPLIEPTDPEQPDLCEVFGVGDFEFVTCQWDDSQFGVNNMLSFVFYTEEGWYISDSGDLVKGSDNGSLLLLTIYPQSLTALSGMYPANDNCRLMEVSGGSQSVSKAVSGDIIISVNEEGIAYDFVYSLTMNNGTTIRGVISGVCADEIDQEQAVENVQSGKVQSTKVIRDGQLYIIRGDKTFNALGAEVK